jgi:hypothetical protein
VEYLINNDPRRTRTSAPIAPQQASVAQFVMDRKPDDFSLGSSLLATKTRNVKTRLWCLTCQSLPHYGFFCR